MRFIRAVSTIQKWRRTIHVYRNPQAVIFNCIHLDGCHYKNLDHTVSTSLDLFTLCDILFNHPLTSVFFYRDLLNFADTFKF